MNLLKKSKLIIIVILLLSNIIPYNTYSLQNTTAQPQLKVAVFINNFEDSFLYEVKKNLEDIQIENSGKVQFTFFMQKKIKVFKMRALKAHLMKILTFL